MRACWAVQGEEATGRGFFAVWAEVIHHALSPSSNPASLSIFKEPVQIVVTEVTLTSFN